MDWKQFAYKMKNILKNNKILLLFRFILAFIFIYASIDKIMNPLEFSNSIDNYHITPISLNNIFALIVPWIELVVGFCLLFNVLFDGAVNLTIALMIWFIFILTQALFRGINLDCGCFDLLEKTDDVNLRAEMINRIVQDVFFLLMAFVLKMRDKIKWKDFTRF